MDREIGRKMTNARKEFKKSPRYNEYYNPYTKTNITNPQYHKVRPRYNPNNQGRRVSKYKKKNLSLLQKMEKLTRLLLAGILITAISLHNNNLAKHGLNEPTDYNDFGGISGRFDDNDPKGRVKNKIIDEAIRQGVDPNLALGIAETESQFSQSARSGAGAIGVFQLMPETAKGLNVDPYDEDDNIRGGIKYIKQLLEMYDGDEKKALAAYNWGMGNVNRKGLEKAPTETKKYVPKVLTAKVKYEEARKGKATPSSSNVGQKGGKVRGYTLAKNVKISEPMRKYLENTKGSGYITSGIRGNSTSAKSHTSGNKIDVAIDNNKNNIIKIAVPFMFNPATVHVSFECLGPAPNPFNSIEAKRKATIKSKQIADEIVRDIRNKYPEIDARIKNGSLQAITNWGWLYGTGPHLDILIDPNKVQSVNKDFQVTNESMKKAEVNIKNINAKPQPKLLTKNENKSDKLTLNMKDNIRADKGKLNVLSHNQTYKNSNKKKFS